jgi:hypothetical protein
MNLLRLFAGVFLTLLSLASAAPPDRSAGQLDQKRLHSDYNEGNFEKVVAALEGFMAAHKTYSFEDSVFIAKHLAVVYTANPDTREKGKYFMYRLLALLPSAKLVDMYVSDEIDRIFDKVREEFVTRQRSFGVDTTQMGMPEKAPAGARGKETAASERPARGKQSHAGIWIAGGAAVAVAGLAATYFIHMGEETAPDRVYKVPKD